MKRNRREPPTRDEEAETLSVAIALPTRRRRALRRPAGTLSISRPHELRPTLRCDRPDVDRRPEPLRRDGEWRSDPAGSVSEVSAYLAAARQARLSALAWPDDADSHKRRAHAWLARARAAGGRRNRPRCEASS